MGPDGGLDDDGFERWLRDRLPDTWIRAVDGADAVALDQFTDTAIAHQILVDAAAAGWLTPDWPRQYGGRETTPATAGRIKAALSRWRVGDVRTAIGTAWVGPTILQWGTDAQRQRWLPPIARAEELWCQLFSEPEAGSDLASLRLTARRNEDQTWTLNGTKVWTSRANICRRGLLIARGDSSQTKHRGMIAFGFDMTTPGVVIRPIKQITGDSEFYEVIIDEAIVPDADRIGAMGQGWEVCRTALSFERVAGSGVGAAPPGSVVGRSMEELISRYHGTVRSDLRDRVVREWIRAQLIEWLNARVAARRAAGQPAGPEGSVTKVLQATHTQHLQELFVDLAGIAGVAYVAGDAWAEPNTWAFLRVRAKTIAGGTTEVLKNQIAERTLGLPRDEDPTRMMPWSEALVHMRGAR